MTDEKDKAIRGMGLVHGNEGPYIGEYRRANEIGRLIYEGMRPGVEYKVFIAPSEFRPVHDWMTQSPGDKIEEIRMLVALADHNKAEIGEWAIFRGWATKQAEPPARVMTSPGKELHYFANPQHFGPYLVYQRVEPQGDEIFEMDATPSDEAAAMRA